MDMYLFFDTDSDFDPEDVRLEEPSLAEMQEYVGGYIEYAPLTYFYTPYIEEVIVNEEGMIINLPLNQAAMAYLRSTIPLYGNVIAKVHSQVMPVLGEGI